MADVTDTRDVTLDVPEGSPEVIDSFRRFHKKNPPMRPEKIIAKWVSSGQQPWELRSLFVSGTALKKDGSPSVLPAEAEYREWGRDVLPAPDWVLDAIRPTTPTRSVS